VARAPCVRNALSAIGVFGFLFTLGLFAYELFGIKKCHYLIATGDRLERALRVEGQFTSRPRSVANFVNEPFASAVIYPACRRRGCTSRRPSSTRTAPGCSLSSSWALASPGRCSARAVSRPTRGLSSARRRR
jgi:hypothetical protein